LFFGGISGTDLSEEESEEESLLEIPHSLFYNGRKDSLFYYCGRNLRDNRREALKKKQGKSG